MTEEQIDDTIIWDFTKEYCDYNGIELTDIYHSKISDRGCIAIKFRYTNPATSWSRTDVRFMDFEEHNKRMQKRMRKKNLSTLLDLT